MEDVAVVWTSYRVAMLSYKVVVLHDVSIDPI